MLHCSSAFSASSTAAAAAADAQPAHRKLQQGRPGNSGNAGNKGQGNQGQGQGNKDRPNPNRNKGDKSSLSKLNQNALGKSNRPKKTIAAPTSGPGNEAFKSLKTRGNSKQAAKILTDTYNTNSEAAATALSSAATERGDSQAVAEAMAQTTVSAPNVAPSKSCTYMSLWCCLSAAATQNPCQLLCADPCVQLPACAAAQ